MLGVGLYFIIIFYILFFICMYVHNTQKKPHIQMFKFKSRLFYSIPNRDWSFTLMMIIIYFTIILFVLAVCLMAILYIDNQFGLKDTEMINNIFDIEGIIITYAAMVISIFTFYSALSPDEYYFRISKREILKKYGLYLIYQVLGGFVIFFYYRFNSIT